MMLKKIMVALLFVASTATFFSCSKQTSQVEPQTEVKNTIRHNKSTSQLAQILANDADFQASMTTEKAIYRQSYNYLVGLNTGQREAIAQTYHANPTEENFISLLGIDATQYYSSEAQFKKSIDRLIANHSLEGEDIGEIIVQARDIMDMILGHIADCYDAYLTRHKVIGGQIQSQQISITVGNAQHLDNRDAFFSCAISPFWK